MTIEQIAVFHHPANGVCAWACADGIVSTLSAMGYGVLDCGLPGQKPISLDLLRQADLVLLSGPEHYAGGLYQLYGDAWQELRPRTALWYSESAFRDDKTFDFATVNWFASQHYYPARQDAASFGGRWLPFGADERLFKPSSAPKAHRAGFVGNIYPKREAYLQRAGHLIDHIRAGQHPHPRRSFELLAEAYASTDIFVNLPAYSRLLVTKVTEVMACGTMLVTPRMDHPSAVDNLAQFEDRRHLVYYDPERPEELGEIIAHYLANPDELAAVAQAGREEVLRSHTLEHRLRTIIADRQFAYDPAASSRHRRDAARRFKLVTAWETSPYFDKATNTIRHAPDTSGLPPVMLEASGLRARLILPAANPGHDVCQVGFLGPESNWREPGMTGGHVRVEFNRTPPDFDIEPMADGCFSLRHKGEYISADPDGVVRNDRAFPGDWERFRLVDAGA